MATERGEVYACIFEGCMQVFRRQAMMIQHVNSAHGDASEPSEHTASSTSSSSSSSSGRKSAATALSGSKAASSSSHPPPPPPPPSPPQKAAAPIASPIPVLATSSSSSAAATTNSTVNIKPETPSLAKPKMAPGKALSPPVPAPAAQVLLPPPQQQQQQQQQPQQQQMGYYGNVVDARLLQQHQLYGRSSTMLPLVPPNSMMNLKPPTMPGFPMLSQPALPLMPVGNMNVVMTPMMYPMPFMPVYPNVQMFSSALNMGGYDGNGYAPLAEPTHDPQQQGSSDKRLYQQINRLFQQSVRGPNPSPMVTPVWNKSKLNVQLKGAVVGSRHTRHYGSDSDDDENNRGKRPHPTTDLAGGDSASDNSSSDELAQPKRQLEQPESDAHSEPPTQPKKRGRPKKQQQLVRWYPEGVLPDEWVDEDDSSAAPKEKQIAIEVSSLSQNQRRYPLRNVLDVITQRPTKRPRVIVPPRSRSPEEVVVHREPKVLNQAAVALGTQLLQVVRTLYERQFISFERKIILKAVLLRDQSGPMFGPVASVLSECARTKYYRGCADQLDELFAASKMAIGFDVVQYLRTDAKHKVLMDPELPVTLDTIQARLNEAHYKSIVELEKDIDALFDAALRGPGTRDRLAHAECYDLYSKFKVLMGHASESLPGKSMAW